jgi:TDG/mug DNA glycosylase family protein
VHRILVDSASKPVLGLQSARLADARLFLVPNPSGANAHVTPAEQTRWYDRVYEALRDTAATDRRG